MAKALDRLAELLTAKTTEAMVVPKAVDGASQTEGVERLELTPNEVKLEGCWREVDVGVRNLCGVIFLHVPSNGARKRA